MSPERLEGGTLGPPAGLCTCCWLWRLVLKNNNNKDLLEFKVLSILFKHEVLHLIRPCPSGYVQPLCVQFWFHQWRQSTGIQVAWLPSPLPREELTSFPLPIRCTQPQHPDPAAALGTEGEGSQHRDTAPLPCSCRKSLHCSDLPILWSASVCLYEEGYLPFPQSSSRPTEEKQHYKSNAQVRRHSVPVGRLLHSVALECHCRNYYG